MGSKERVLAITKLIEKQKSFTVKTIKGFLTQKNNFSAFPSLPSLRMSFGLLRASFGLRNFIFGLFRPYFGLIFSYIGQLKSVNGHLKPLFGQLMMCFGLVLNQCGGLKRIAKVLKTY